MRFLRRGSIAGLLALFWANAASGATDGGTPDGGAEIAAAAVDAGVGTAVASPAPTPATLHDAGSSGFTVLPAATKQPAQEPPVVRPPPIDVHLGGLLQVEYLGRATENHLARRLSAAPAPLPPAGVATDTPVLDESTLLLRRARLSADGRLAPWLRYFAELDGGLGNLALLEYRLSADIGRRATINVGQMRVPFSYSWLMREDRLAFPERSIATEQFRYDYDIGVSVEARFLSERLSLIAGGYNGGGRVLAHNDNLDPMLVLRLEGRPIGRMVGPPAEASGDEAPATALVVGASMAADYVPTPPAYGYLSGSPQSPRQLVVDANGDGLPDGITTLSAEVDVKLARRGLAVEAEGYFRHEWWHDIPALQPISPTVFAPRTTYWGMVVQVLQAFARDRVQAGVRGALTQLSPLSPGWQRYETHLCVANSGTNYTCSLPYAGTRFEGSAVAGYVLIPQTLQISAMYSFLRWAGSPAPADAREHRMILLMQLSF